MSTLGIIGGLGPAASAYFYELLVSHAGVKTDQEHPEVLIVSRPSVPDRTAFLLGKSACDPAPPIIDAGRMLVSMGAEIIALPCVTAHGFYERLADGIGVPVIHMIRETALELRRRSVVRAGLLATEGTLACGVFQRELSALGIEAILPSTQAQALVTHMIYDCVKANKAVGSTVFPTVSDELRALGADALVLACTELSLLNRGGALGGCVVDAMEVLAIKALELCM